jgi:hypothetical protein
MRIGSIPFHGWALGPIHFPRGVILLRNEAGYGFPSLSDHDFFSSSNPAQQAGVAVSQISNGCCFHDAPLLEHNGRLSTAMLSIMVGPHAATLLRTTPTPHRHPTLPSHTEQAVGSSPVRSCGVTESRTPPCGRGGSGRSSSVAGNGAELRAWRCTGVLGALAAAPW